MLPRGFRFGATACGLKRAGRLDLALITSDLIASAAAVFTTNRVQAAPVQLSRAHLLKSSGRMRGVVVNSGNANCCTGPEGMAAAIAAAKAAARELRCRPDQIIVCSTGVIGVPLRVTRILRVLPELAAQQAATPADFAQLTRAILTTDTRPKWAATSCRIGGQTVRLLGCAKGAGMIHPQMATMLAFVLTDATIRPRLLQAALSRVVGHTFNAITVDGDTSTNDTLVVLANGASGSRLIRTVQRNWGPSAPLPSASLGPGRASAAGDDFRRFIAALESVCRTLALTIVADGEGAQRVVEIVVRGAASDETAQQVARTIAQSPLVKTALAGADPNWGRILAAAGRAGVAFDPARVGITLTGITVCRSGRAYPFKEELAHRKLLRNYVPIVVYLHGGRGRARVWTCDLTADYVRVNASYRT
jgi:glutamate N-acetyltransferase/amino-acid N-acetyltransferase